MPLNLRASKEDELALHSLQKDLILVLSGQPVVVLRDDLGVKDLLERDLLVIFVLSLAASGLESDKLLFEVDDDKSLLYS